MVTEQAKTLAALKKAIQMEIDGRNFYLKAGAGSSNELGKNLLKSLAAEEDSHRRKFEQIYEAISARKNWPRGGLELDGGRKLRTIFARASEKIGTALKVPASELDAVQVAIAMESKTFDFYKRQGSEATNTAEKEFYEALAAQEMEHHLVLNDYSEYLSNPAAWFVTKEHHSLDGG